jgi:formate hydrogenlyase subunit 6/NADH:ubiquinone oxidoreductase subunit I
MSTTIYYFTGTGNSLHIAKCLKEKLNECELIPIAGIIKQNSINATSEKVGLIFPIYTWALPKIVYDFIEKIDLSNTKYIFAVTTMGGFSKQYVEQALNKLLKPKNKELDAALHIRVFSNYIVANRINPLPRSKEKIKKRIKKAELKLEQIVEIVRNSKKGKTKKGAKYPKMKGSYEYFIKTVNSSDEKYYSDEKCNGCGICQQICPVDNIKLINEKPEWQHNCQFCLGCLHYCPQKAIQYGEQTINRARYNHPYITTKELINQKAKK